MKKSERQWGAIQHAFGEMVGSGLNSHIILPLSIRPAKTRRAQDRKSSNTPDSGPHALSALARNDIAGLRRCLNKYHGMRCCQHESGFLILHGTPLHYPVASVLLGLVKGFVTASNNFLHQSGVIQ